MLDQTPFSIAKNEVGTLFGKCRAHPLLHGSGSETISAFDCFFEGQNHSISVKELAAHEMNAYLTWAAALGLKKIGASTPELIEAFIKEKNGDVKKQKHTRYALNLIFKVLAEKKVMASNPVKSMKLKRLEVYELPALITLAGEPAVTIVNSVLEERQARVKKKGLPVYLSILRHFAKAMAKKGLYDIGLISTGDTHDYIQALPRKKRDNYVAALREIFAHLVRGGVLKKNSFMFRHENQQQQDKKLAWSLLLARQSGPEFELSLRDFLEKNPKKEDGTTRLAEIESFSRWMVVAERVSRLSDIAPLHLARYHAFKLSAMNHDGRYRHFSFVISFMNSLYEKKLISADIALPFRQGAAFTTSKAMAADMWGMAPLLLQRDAEGGKQPEVFLPQDFTLRDLNALSLSQRRWLSTRIIALRIAVAKQHNNPLTQDQAAFFKEKLARFGVMLGIIQADDMGTFTQGFLTRFNSGDAKKWAGNFEKRWAHNTSLAKTVRRLVSVRPAAASRISASAMPLVA